MHRYFYGERIEAICFIVPAALVLFVIAAAAIRSEGGAFGYAMAAPLVLFGLVALSTGIAVGVRTPAQVAAVERAYAASPNTMAEAELPRMQKVNANWPIYLSVWTTLVLLGLALRFGLRADWAHGLGPGLIIVGAMGFLIDGFAERRARPYTAALEAIAAPRAANLSAAPSH
jgi:hypothetical protein